MSILRADNLTNRDADGAPLMTHGVRVTGVVTANSANFTGDVSIGGTLTYQDLTNLDSVGLVTARTGVRVTAGGVDISGGGLNVTGISTFNDNIVGDNATNISGINSVTATSFSGNGDNLSGIEFGVRNFVASGTIPNGSTVVINTDGTVGVVTDDSGTNLTTKNYVGLAAETISDGSTGKVNIFGGINESQSGLTTARKYYVQSGGGIGLTASTPSVVAGTSISSTKIIVKS